MSEVKQAKRKGYIRHVPFGVFAGENYHVTIQYTVIYKHYIKGNCHYLTGEKDYEIDWYELEQEECAREDLVERFGEAAIKDIEEQLD